MEFEFNNEIVCQAAVTICNKMVNAFKEGILENVDLIPDDNSSSALMEALMIPMIAVPLVVYSIYKSIESTGKQLGQNLDFPVIASLGNAIIQMILQKFDSEKLENSEIIEQVCLMIKDELEKVSKIAYQKEE